MKKFSAGIALTLGICSSLITLSGALPQFTNIFIGAIGISIGFFLGAFSPNKENVDSMDALSKHLLLRIVLLTVPFFCLLLTIVVIHWVGLLTSELVKSMLTGGLIVMGIMYIVASLYIGDKYSGVYEYINNSDIKSDSIK